MIGWLLDAASGRWRRPGWLHASLLLCAAACVAPGPLAAQAGLPVGEPPVQEEPSGESPGEPECRIGRISAVWVDNHSVFDLTDPKRSERFDWAFRLANRLHVRTREDVIRRELLFGEDDCYDPVLLLESERILRATSFIAEVDIYGVEQPDGTYHVIVDTRDEWSTHVQPQTGAGTGLQVTGLAIREDNLLGTGRQASAFYLEDREARVYGVSYLDPQLFKTRWQAGLAVGRTPLGAFFRETVEYPFVGETGRRAVRHHFEHHDRYFGYLLEHEGLLREVLIPERRRSFDLGGAIRFGERGSLMLLGAMLTGNWVTYPEDPHFADPSLPSLDSVGAPVRSLLNEVRDVRAMLLFGQRNIVFLRRRGLDTVRATEDVRLGVEVELGLGTSIGAFSSNRDLSLDLGFFAGGQLGDAVLSGTQLRLEGRRNYDAPSDVSEWDDVFGQLDAWAYWRPSPESRHTLVGMVAASGGWHPRVPFQLTLGGATGMRGHPFHAAVGTRRVVTSLEARSYLNWPHPELFDFGSTLFVDLGRIWAEALPQNGGSGLYANAGIGLRAAFPPGSRNTYRIELAVPLSGRVEASDLVFSVGVGHVIGRSIRNDPEMYRSSRRGAAASLFGVRTDPVQ
jgi:hypothetical protein